MWKDTAMDCIKFDTFIRMAAPYVNSKICFGVFKLTSVFIKAMHLIPLRGFKSYITMSFALNHY